MPSSSSLIGGSVLVGSIIGAHLVYLCANYQAIFPNLSSTFSIDWPPETVSSLRPLRTVVHSHAFDLSVLMLSWLLVGLVVYIALLYTVRFVRALRSGGQMYVPAENQVVYNPTRHAAVVRFLWRSAILGAAMLATALFASSLHFVWAWDQRMYDAYTLVEFLRFGAFGYLVLMCMLHAYVFLARLFLFRTRILGEVIS